jgi:hypothetical protein
VYFSHAKIQFLFGIATRIGYFFLLCEFYSTTMDTVTIKKGVLFGDLRANNHKNYNSDSDHTNVY